jgi:hypothetical protein
MEGQGYPYRIVLFLEDFFLAYSFMFATLFTIPTDQLTTLKHHYNDILSQTTNQVQVHQEEVLPFWLRLWLESGTIYDRCSAFGASEERGTYSGRGFMVA